MSKTVQRPMTKVHFACVLIALIVLSGCAVWKPVATNTSPATTDAPSTPATTAVAATTALAKLSFQRSWHAQEVDGSGKNTSGTEIMRILPYKGKLYASNSQWMETSPGRPCQLLALDSPDGTWRLEHEFALNNLRLVCLQVVTFTTNASGNTIEPVTMLLAAPDVIIGDAQVFSLDDSSGKWVPMSLGMVATYTTTRAIGSHRDSVTGIDLVFAGNDTLGTLTGAYDPSAPGRIAWQKTRELTVPSGERVMGFTNCNGLLYCATTRHIFVRTDGPSPSWQEVYFCPQETWMVGIRGLTAVPNPSGNGQVLLFAALNSVRRINPADGYQETVELDMKFFLGTLWNTTIPYVLCAYNDFLAYTVPDTGEKVWLFGFESMYSPLEVQKNPQWRTFKIDFLGHYYAAEGRYFIRHATEKGIAFEVAEVADPGLPTLVAVRTIAVSPFPADQGRVLYFGGFDCNSQPSHNTGWIYRGALTGN